VWQRIAIMGVAPKALLFSQQIDSFDAGLGKGGMIVADVLANKR